MLHEKSSFVHLSLSTRSVTICELTRLWHDFPNRPGAGVMVVTPMRPAGKSRRTHHMDSG